MENTTPIPIADHQVMDKKQELYLLAQEVAAKSRELNIVYCPELNPQKLRKCTIEENIALLKDVMIGLQAVERSINEEELKNKS